MALEYYKPLIIHGIRIWRFSILDPLKVFSILTGATFKGKNMFPIGEQWEHSAILSIFIKLPFAIKIFVLSIFEWPLKAGFTVCYLPSHA